MTKDEIQQAAIKYSDKVNHDGETSFSIAEAFEAGVNHISKPLQDELSTTKKVMQDHINEQDKLIKEYINEIAELKNNYEDIRVLNVDLQEDLIKYETEITQLGSKVNELGKPDLSLYNSNFLNWLDKYFTKSIKILRYKSKTQSNKMYTLQELEQKFNKAYKENPYNKNI
jgi:hypothetical protein